MYGVSSTILGPMSSIFTSSGRRAMRMDMMIVFKQTLLPVPVRPAMIPVFVHLSLVLMLGLWIPPFLADWYRSAAKLIG